MLLGDDAGRVPMSLADEMGCISCVVKSIFRF